MSEFIQARAEFNRAVAANGWQNPGQVQGEWPVSPEKWLRRFYRPLEIDISRQRRLANKFLVGADPEFIFEQVDAANGRAYVHANAPLLGFKAGLPFGADNNGRLMEIRPVPSRFVLETVTSIWSTLKWMSLINPETLKLIWRPGAFYENDGLGGHVHFGRRRPTHPREIAALDCLSFWMFHGNVWDQVEGRKRVAGAQGGGPQGYGRLSDKRMQPYGYEYRTFPSWLCSPWMAYFSMTLAKLAVLDPMLFPLLEQKMEAMTPADIRARLTAILAYWKGRDDDAALAHYILAKHGFPRWTVEDFKAAWGIFGGGQVPVPQVKIQVLPTSIPALPEEIAAMAKALCANHPPEIVSLEPSWSPTSLPTGYIPLINGIETRHAPGVGELCVDLCCHTSAPVTFLYQAENNNQMFLPDALLAQMKPGVIRALVDKFPEVHYNETHINGVKQPWPIYLSKKLCENNMRNTMRGVLLSGILPIWRNRDVKAASHLAWRAEWIKTAADKAEKKPAKVYPHSVEIPILDPAKAPPVIEAPAYAVNVDPQPRWIIRNDAVE